MGLAVPPHKFKIMLESNPLKPTMLVGGLGVPEIHSICVYVCMYVYIYIYIYMYTHIYDMHNMYIYIYIYRHIHTYDIHIHMRPAPDPIRYYPRGM